MEHKEILELFSRACAPANETNGDLLRDAIATFSTNPRAAIRTLNQLQADDLSGFTMAAVQLLVSSEETSRGQQYVAGLMFTGNLLIDLLLDPRALGLDAVLPLARNLATAGPLLDVHLIQRLMATSEGEAGAIDSKAALRALELVDEVSDCSRLAPYMIQLMQHPDAHVRSKATLLLGRANLNLTRTNTLLASEDGRVSANTVESLWGRRESSVRPLLWEATKNPNGRTVVNALLELCRLGDLKAYSKLTLLADAPDPRVRSSAAWAMGESGDAQFKKSLEKLEQDGDEKVRAMAAKSRKKLQTPDPAEAPQLAEIPAAVPERPPAESSGRVQR